MSDISYVETMLAAMPRSLSRHMITLMPVESTISHWRSKGKFVELEEGVRMLEDEGAVELLDSLLMLEELSSVWLDDVADFSEELLGVSATEEEIPGGISTEDELLGGIAIEDELYGLITPLEEIIGNLNEELLNFSADEESASSTELLRRSWLSGKSMAEELDVVSVELLLPFVFGATESGSASLTQAVIYADVIPSKEATPTFVALDKRVFPETFFFSIFIIPPPSLTLYLNIVCFGI